MNGPFDENYIYRMNSEKTAIFLNKLVYDFSIHATLFKFYED